MSKKDSCDMLKLVGIALTLFTTFVACLETDEECNC